MAIDVKIYIMYIPLSVYCFKDLRDEGYATNEIEDKKICNTEAALAKKSEGNKQFQAKNFSAGKDLYTEVKIPVI